MWRLEDVDAASAYFHVSVKDMGIGIRPEERDKLFSAFDRLDAGRTRAIEGTGLGLTITHRLLSLMGSELKVRERLRRGLGVSKPRTAARNAWNRSRRGTTTWFFWITVCPVWTGSKRCTG